MLQKKYERVAAAAMPRKEFSVDEEISVKLASLMNFQSRLVNSFLANERKFFSFKQQQNILSQLFGKVRKKAYVYV